MKNAFFYNAFAFLMSCGGQKEKTPAVTQIQLAENSKQENETVRFEKITLSAFCFCRGWNTKDVEIHKDGEIFYRVRDDWSIGENYAGSLDSASMVEVRSFIGTLDINSLRYRPEDIHSYYSLHIVMPEEEIMIEGGSDFNQLYKLLKLVDALKLPTSNNRHFSTAREVPPPPPQEFRGKHYEALLDSL